MRHRPRPDRVQPLLEHARSVADQAEKAAQLCTTLIDEWDEATLGELKQAMRMAQQSLAQASTAIRALHEQCQHPSEEPEPAPSRVVSPPEPVQRPSARRAAPAAAPPPAPPPVEETPAPPPPRAAAAASPARAVSKRSVAAAAKEETSRAAPSNEAPSAPPSARMTMLQVIQEAGKFASGSEPPSSVAREWESVGLLPDEARAWLQARCYDPKAAFRLRAAGVEPTLAAQAIELNGRRDSIGYWVAAAYLAVDEAAKLARVMAGRGRG